MSKGTDSFKRKIKHEMELRAFKDPLFHKKYSNPKKNIEDCVTHILSTVQSSGCNGFEDDEIYGMAVHYYSEDDLKVTKNANVQKVVVNHQVKLSAEEIKAAKEEARLKVIEEEMLRIKGQYKKSSTVAKKEVETKTLFDDSKDEKPKTRSKSK